MVKGIVVGELDGVFAVSDASPGVGVAVWSVDVGGDPDCAPCELEFAAVEDSATGIGSFLMVASLVGADVGVNLISSSADLLSAASCVPFLSRLKMARARVQLFIFFLLDFSPTVADVSASLLAVVAMACGALWSFASAGVVD